MDSNTHSLQSVLDRIITKYGWTEQVYYERIKEDWNDFIGDIPAKKIKIKALKDKILFISSSASVWSNELILRKEEIIKSINTKYGKFLIDDIVVK